METPEPITLIPGDVTSPHGFLAAGVHCGIKQQRRDLALLYSEVPASAAGLFTTNRVKAAPVRYCEETLSGGVAQAIVVNSGNANACTGPQGLRDAYEMAEITARALGIPRSHVLVCSTGVIGVPLPMEAIRRGIPQAVRALERSGEAAAEAILTTDAFPKRAAAQVRLPEGVVTVGGIAKGAGMIHPQLATTLCFLTTDARISPGRLREALRGAAEVSFNRITVDGDTSTNDSLIVLANGQSGIAAEEGEAYRRFCAALTAVAEELAKMVVRDGEGATRLVRVEVTGALDEAEARRAAYTVATSLLVKTMLHGGEPNWGRVLAAVGRAGVALEESRTRVWFGPVLVVQDGVGIPEALGQGAQALRDSEVTLRVDLGVGSGRWWVWTCDLSEEYVRLNGAYIT
ncbi:MAG: bifunctional glutamate N-acetyltransferase/amino-acid acetyltransferase ArgJ [Armatimonadota bacterium]|nr:bifunctional glutamate N-acetyltransferase/amino-acid acetyltransferase ArgJ [Armatimonadota bacterium]MDR7443154.1 bifunctional glutamate N-acetyltransferase/amino-acid acetyltransferase ArgJ [Armatimonadota bacterium]MDR7569575.1 bifunctional glutamate N-acetyltransferase/amino-acid acetyltransferase ArgJ [Armatimonadota bacterium]MDR7614629.1 bifunctional glutamate N-acetyltransferase/amino-acid acetyltransferase ArgJ [Armatimonadota bacterium]